MTVTADDIQHISKLSRLKIEQEQADQLTNDLSNILTFIEQLNAVEQCELSEKKPQSDFKAREDAISEQDISADYYQQNSQLTEDAHYLVPTVIRSEQ